MTCHDVYVAAYMLLLSAQSQKPALQLLSRVWLATKQRLELPFVGHLIGKSIPERLQPVIESVTACWID